MKDPAAKRKAIGSGFIDVVSAFAQQLQKTHNVHPRFLVQVRHTPFGLHHEDLRPCMVSMSFGVDTGQAAEAVATCDLPRRANC